MRWWLTVGLNSTKLESMPNPHVSLTTDFSTLGWGAHLDNSDTSQGFWSHRNQKLHINALELKAVLMGLQSLCSQFYNCHILVHIENTTAVSYINNMGGTHSRLCSTTTRDVILWAKERHIWLTATHIVGNIITPD